MKLMNKVTEYIEKTIIKQSDIILKCGKCIKIGETFGGKDHATVMSGVKKVENSLKTDPDMLIAIAELKKKLS